MPVPKQTGIRPEERFFPILAVLLPPLGRAVGGDRTAERHGSPMSRKFLTLLLSAALLLSLMGTALPAAAAPSQETSSPEPTEVTGEEIAGAKSYTDFLAEQGITDENAAPSAGAPIVLDAEKLAEGSGDFTTEDGSVLIEEEGSLTVSFPGQPGLYNLIIEYDPVAGRSNDVELAVRLNGELPYQEAGSLVLTRLWKDKGGKIETDANNNDIRPSQEEITLEERGWLTHTAMDSSGFHTQALLFPVEAENTVTLYVSRENVHIRSIAFRAAEGLPTYAEYAAQHADAKDAAASLPSIEAELPAWKNDATIVAASDRVSPATTPYKGSKISLNNIGGSAWASPGKEIAWTFTPEESGLYEIRLLVRQNYTRGFYATRSLKIDGEVPFAEAQNLRFTYKNGWVIYTVSANGEPCKFYFEEGKTYTLSLEVTLGDFGEILGRTQESVNVLNDIYRELLMIIGSTPDTMRDYNLDDQIPETIEEMLVQADKLEQIAADIQEIAGFSGSELASLHKMADQLREFHKDPREISKRMTYFKDNIAALNTWMLNAKSLPMDIDTVTIAAPGSPVPKADANFFEMAGYMFQMFIASFIEDYNSLSGTGEPTDTEITVWSTTGRDQATILNDLIRSSYTPHSRDSLGRTVGVSLQVVQADAILPSVAAGNGPDVLMNAGMQLPINYATRHAAADLRTVADPADLEQVLSRFRESALTPLTFNGGIYGLPEQQTYPVMFYRTDILSELGIPAPTLENPWTWDDVIKYLPVLQKKNMTFLMDTGTSVGADVSVGMTTYAMFVFQAGGQFYRDGGIATDLDSEVAVEAFKTWTKFYTSYGLPTNFNIANRFRTGESPIVISDMTLYNQLAVSAPEIKGLWGISLVPGTVREDGTVDHSVRSSVTSSILFTNADDKEAAWDFMKWWTDTETQVSYSREMESLLGTSARYPSANVAAMEQLPWSSRDYRVLAAQAAWAKGVPEVPGSYYTSRHINNAFRAVCIKEDADEPREAILQYASIINDEIYDKRTEFGLPTEER